MSDQYLQGTHIPKISVQDQFSSQTELLPDWLNASYIDIHEKAVDYRFHTVSETDIMQPDHIAYTFYGDSNWWWIICSINGIVNPMTDMYLGQKLKIPNLQILQLILAPKQRTLVKTDDFAVI